MANAAAVISKVRREGRQSAMFRRMPWSPGTCRGLSSSGEAPAMGDPRRRRRILARPSGGQTRDNHASPSSRPVSMIDPALLRSQSADVAARLRALRGFDLDVDRLERLETERKQLQVRTQELQNLRNTRSKAIGQAKAKGEDVAPMMAEVAAFADELRASEARLDAIRADIEAI